MKCMHRFLLVLAFLVSFNFFIPTSFAAITVIPPQEVRKYVLSLLVTDEVKTVAQTPGNSIYQLLETLSQNPLFIDIPAPADTLHRENFTAYLAVLNVRNFVSTIPIINDFYIVHELTHIVEMTYSDVSTPKEWRQKMVEQEMEVSFKTEMAIFFEFPQFREMLKLKSIFVDEFLNDPAVRAQYVQNPTKTLDMMRARKISTQQGVPVTSLNHAQFRSWYYGRTMELWADIYGPQRKDIEAHMIRYYQLLKKDSSTAIHYHLKWLEKKSTDGVLFKKELSEYVYRARTLFPATSQGQLLNPFSYEAFCKACLSYAEELDHLVATGQIEWTSKVPAARKLLDIGVAWTVYSYVFPESTAVYADVQAKLNYSAMHGKAFTRRQDPVHMEFVEEYKRWASPVVNGLNSYEYAYPSNGSSEALKDTMSYFKGHHPDVVLHVFEGEYEGATEIAKAIALKVVRHTRDFNALQKAKSEMKPGDLFYISQPSGIDGNVWLNYDKFIQFAEKSKLNVIVDLAYVGLVSRRYQINVSSPSIVTVLFSLSKSFGVYYHRIGGAFARFPQPLLYGNKWFKNLISLKFGTELMKRYSVHEMARRYRWAQTASLQLFNSQMNTDLQPSDVILLAHKKVNKQDAASYFSADIAEVLYRPTSETAGILRVNLSPSINYFVDAKNKSMCVSYFL